MNFGFPATSNNSVNYAHSQVSSTTTQFETNYSGVENGGLFSKDECRSLARYEYNNVEKSSKPMMETEMALARLYKLLNG